MEEWVGGEGVRGEGDSPWDELRVLRAQAPVTEASVTAAKRTENGGYFIKRVQLPESNIPLVWTVEVKRLKNKHTFF